mgnify:CR=1 FL=1
MRFLTGLITARIAFPIMEAVLVGISAGFGAFGTAAAAIPDFVPPEYKVLIAVTAWLAGIVGFSIKEALGGQAPNLK